MNLTIEQLAPIRERFERGHYLQAYLLGQQLAPLREWRGAEGRVLAARIVRHLGAPRMARWHFLRAWRENPDDPDVRYHYAWSLLERRGPLPTLHFLNGGGDLPDARAEIRAAWISLRGHVAAILRDFDRAEAELHRADEIGEDVAWVQVEWSYVLEAEDRYEEALAAANRGLAIRPGYRPAVQAAGHVLTLLDRDAEAIELLKSAAKTCECGQLVAQLAALQEELGLYADARQSLERIAELSPLAEEDMAHWLAARRSDLAYYCGELTIAAELAREAKNPFHDKIAERLANAREESRRVVLPVGFVRQHHMTCGPATLASVSRFWSMPVEHLQLAEQICYNGTTNHSERQWANQNGYVTREFTVTWESAVTLIDQGIPFTMVTVSPGNSHLQAVIGYDSFRGTFLIRDPFDRHFGEVTAEGFLKAQRPHGPRGMALVPADQRAKLESIALPDAEQWDLIHQLDGELVAHRREDAGNTYSIMQQASPDHWLTLETRRRMAVYDANPTELLAALDRMLELFPDEQNLQLSRLSSLRELARRDERLDTFRVMCGKKESAPIFWQQYAQELSHDAREHDTAIRLLRRALRYWPTNGGNYYILANILWDKRQFAEALELYRYAACLEDKNENLAQSYFIASRHFKQTESVFEFLRSRFERFGKKSSFPARTLFWAYSHLERMQEAVACLDRALTLRPDDTDLALYAADSLALTGDSQRAKTLLDQVAGKSQQATWLRTAARLASYAGELAESLRLWQQVLEIQPLAIDAHRAVTLLLAETRGQAIALDHLQLVAEQFPHYWSIHRLRHEWLRDEPPEIAETALRKLIEINPADAWSHRELVLLLGRRQRFDEAFASLDIAQRLESNNPYFHCVKGELLGWTGRNDESKAAYREAVRLSVDTDFAIAQLIACCDTESERRDALAFVKQELVRQVIFGDGLLAFREHAQLVLNPDELLGALSDALVARPDLWHAWSAKIQQLTLMNRLEEARVVADLATQRFPLLPRIWLDRSLVCRAAGDRQGEKEAVERALQINPSWGIASRALAVAHERDGDLQKSQTILEQAIARTPLDSVNHGYLAHALWRLGEREAALARVEHAVKLEPGYDWAWDMLRFWSRELERPKHPIEVARELTARRGGEARSWLILAQTLAEPTDFDERLAALEKATQLNPQCTPAYDLRATLLAQALRFDEALAACKPPAWDHRLPIELRARAAWVTAEQGKLTDAIALIRTVLADDPNYYDGWARLADWSLAGNDHKQYLEASRQLVRIAPQNSVSFGYLADAKRRNDDRAGAKADFARSIELAPDYSYGGLHLFDLQFEDDELDQAAATLAVMKTHAGGCFVVAREVQLAVRRRNVTDAIAGLRELCGTSPDENWPITTAVEAIVNAGGRGSAQQVLREAIDRDDCHPEVGRQWVLCSVGLGQWRCGRLLPQLLERGELGRRATLAFLKSLAEGQRRFRLRWFIWRNAQLLRGDTYTWACVGYALNLMANYRAVRRWMVDWRDRSGLEPWMLTYVAESFRWHKRFGEAAEVSRLAMSLTPDHGTGVHAIWLAIDAALAGDTATAAERLTGADQNILEPCDRFLFTITQAIVQVQNAGASARPAAFDAARSSVAKAVADYPYLTHDATRRRLYRRCLFRLARDRGGAFAFLWYLARLIAS